MIQVKDVAAWLETLAPSYMKMDWDNAGLLCGEPRGEVRRILVALDPFEPVCREAADLGADLLVTHHPLIFHPLTHVTGEDDAQRALMFLLRHRISALNAHTNLDCAPEGVNDVLARTLGLLEPQVIEPMGTDAQGRPWGLLRMGHTPEPLAPEAFYARVKASLGTPVLRVAEGGRPVRRVAVGGGACAGEMEAAARAGCDTFVTADCKYNHFPQAQGLGLTLIDAGHFYTENPVCPFLARKLREAFPSVDTVVSKIHRDAMKFV